MIDTRICAECGLLMTNALDAMRSHETDMVNCLQLNVEARLTEELRRIFAPKVVASFNAARLAWEAYCQHLDEHGLLKPALKGMTAD